MTVFGVTGHRSVEQEPGELLQFARLSVARMQEAGATEIITGMALGWDMAVAEACRVLEVPYCAAIPFTGQDAHWRPEDRLRHWHLVQEAARIHVACPLPLNHAYIVRDKWIVNNSEQLWALDSGRPSGSHTTVLYADERGRKVVPLWDDWIRFRAER